MDFKKILLSSSYLYFRRNIFVFISPNIQGGKLAIHELILHLCIRLHNKHRTTKG